MVQLRSDPWKSRLAPLYVTHHSHRSSSCWRILEPAVEVITIHRNEQRVPRSEQAITVWETVVADDSLVNVTTKGYQFVLQCNSQIGPVSVVVGEERHFENAFVEEPTPAALGTVWCIDHGDTVVEHPRTVFSPRV